MFLTFSENEFRILVLVVRKMKLLEPRKNKILRKLRVKKQRRGPSGHPRRLCLAKRAHPGSSRQVARSGCCSRPTRFDPTRTATVKNRKRWVLIHAPTVIDTPDLSDPPKAPIKETVISQHAVRIHNLYICMQARACLVNAYEAGAPCDVVIADAIEAPVEMSLT